jgi:hypothetical protein
VQPFGVMILIWLIKFGGRYSIWQVKALLRVAFFVWSAVLGKMLRWII